MNKSFYLRHEDFNWSIFDLKQFLLEHSDLGYLCFLNEDPCFQCFLIETVKYSRKCLACQFEHNRTAHTSCLEFDSVIGPLKGQLTRHACMRGQNASCAGAVVSHFAE